MAYSPEFIAKISQKPAHLTPSEKARTFATMRGWEYRHPQADNEKFKNMPSELIVAIPGLSMLLDVTTSDTSIHTVTGTASPVVLTKASAGFTRRSRRRYSINISFPEQIFIAASGTASFGLDIDYVTKDSAAGTLTDNNGNPLLNGKIVPDVTLTAPAGEDLAVGRVQFDLPTFNADPVHLDIRIKNFYSESSTTQMSNSNLKDDRGRNLNTIAIDQTDLVNYLMEIVKPSTDAPR